MGKRGCSKCFNKKAFAEFLKQETGKDLPRWRAGVIAFAEACHDQGNLNMGDPGNYRKLLDLYNDRTLNFVDPPSIGGNTLGIRASVTNRQYNGGPA